MNPKQVRNLFISHSWSRPDEFRALQDILDEHPHFAYRAYFVKEKKLPAADFEARERSIKALMQPCHAVLIAAARRAADIEIVNREIAIAATCFAFAKPVIAILPRRRDPRFLPDEPAVDSVVPWSSDAIVEAVESLAVAAAERRGSGRHKLDKLE